MDPQPQDRSQLFAQICAWSAARPDIRALAVVGSGARVEAPADQWSDWDLLLVAADPQVYLATAAWLEEIDPPWVSTVERGTQGQVVERRVLFRCGVDVDFLIVPADDPGVFNAEPLASIIRRGLHILFDRDDQLTPLLAQAGSVPAPRPPSTAEFSELVSDFLFHTVWTAKKIRRGELWTAKSCCDGYMKQHLQTMIAWYTASRQGWETNTWYGGRFLERWAPPEVIAGLGGTFAHYKEEEVWQALEATARLFDTLALETATRLGYPYPHNLAVELQEHVERLKTR